MSELISRSSSRLVEAAALRAELEARREAQARVQPRPVVTVSREFGALGASIARLVAVKLGFECWDQELVQEVSESISKPEQLLASVDERHHSMVLDLLAALFHREEGRAHEYRRELVRVIKALAKKGSAVIVGRGGQFIVAPSKALRVRVTAPLRDRVLGVQKRHGLTPQEAERKVRRVDQERAAFMKDGFDGVITDTENYDLVLDSSSFGREGSATIIEAAYLAKFGNA